MTSRVIGSTQRSESNAKKYLADNEGFSVTRGGGGDIRDDRRDRREVLSPTSAEYVKRTARLFEKSDSETEGRGRMGNGDTGRDETDFGKKPSYLGVSCSNSGYRNVIKYDSKLREGLWSSTKQRESIVLSNHRLRDSSPLKFDQEFRSLNGHSPFEVKTNRTSGCDAVNGGSGFHPPYRMDEFVNISTSTKTISTFRSVERRERGEGGEEDAGRGRKDEGGEREETWRKSTSSYSNVGINPKSLKSPEKNCNSFLRSINSFENNCKKSERESVKSSCYRKIRSENVSYSPSNSIQQRIERLYGPGALAQGFYVHNSNTRTRLKSETLEESPLPSCRLSESINQNVKSSIESIPDLLPAAPEVVLPIEKYSNGDEVNGCVVEEVTSNEKNGRYFLKLLQKETDKLESLAGFAESELESGENLPEEVSGKLRAAAGKARLLVRQKLHQFEGLCQKNLNEKPGEQFPTTSEDLAGFWDMVMLQVVQVYGVFDEIDKLKKNNWKPVSAVEEGRSELMTTTTTPDSGKKSGKKSVPKSASSEKSEKAEMAKKAREETRRKMMEERRRKVKELRENKTVSNESEIEIFAK